MKTIRKRIRGKLFEFEPRKEGESRKDYRQYLEECYRTKFPYKKYRKFRFIKRIKQFNRQEKALNKMEKISYNYSFKKDNVNFDGPDCLMRILFGRKSKKDKKVEKVSFLPNLLNKKEKKQNKVVGFFKNLFGRKNKNIDTEETFEENLPNIEETYEENLPEFEETFEENLPEFEETFEENLPEFEETFEENLPEFEETFEENLPELKKENTNSLPIEIKSYRDLNKEEVSNMSVIAQLRYLQEQNKKQAEIINSTINNYNVYVANFKKLEQENLRLRKEITRLSYNPNSFVIKNAYEEAVREDRERKINNIYNSLASDRNLINNKCYINDDLTANQYNIASVSYMKDENERTKVLTKYYNFKNNSNK